ncbi:MAG: hypothetical protein GAK38_00178 [Xylophilus sp.]|nr:MAG: hypothetical protein GAK38_00178 [Xylophilus sp.]
MTTTHAFFLLLACGVSGLLLAAEVLLLWRRCRRTRDARP